MRSQAEFVRSVAYGLLGIFPVCRHPTLGQKTNAENFSNTLLDLFEGWAEIATK